MFQAGTAGLSVSDFDMLVQIVNALQIVAPANNVNVQLSLIPLAESFASLAFDMATALAPGTSQSTGAYLNSLHQLRNINIFYLQTKVKLKCSMTTSALLLGFRNPSTRQIRSLF